MYVCIHLCVSVLHIHVCMFMFNLFVYVLVCYMYEYKAVATVWSAYSLCFLATASQHYCRALKGYSMVVLKVHHSASNSNGVEHHC